MHLIKVIGVKTMKIEYWGFWREKRKSSLKQLLLTY